MRRDKQNTNNWKHKHWCFQHLRNFAVCLSLSCLTISMATPKDRSIYLHPGLGYSLVLNAGSLVFCKQCIRGLNTNLRLFYVFCYIWLCSYNTTPPKNTIVSIFANLYDDFLAITFTGLTNQKTWCLFCQTSNIARFAVNHTQTLPTIHNY